MHTTTISLQPSLAAQAQRVLHDLAGALRDAGRRWRLRRQAHATARALSGLSDHQLRDLGLDRSELLSAAGEVHGLSARERCLVMPGRAA